MKYCSKCGAQQDEKTTFCEFCGSAFNENNRAPNQNQNPNQNNYNNFGNNQGNNYNNFDGPSTGFAILSFFFPIVGFILYAVWCKDQPLKAKSCIKGAIIGFVVNIVVGIISTICMMYNSEFFPY